jgi:cytochrome c oxidase cbb3-type subunit 3
VVSPATSAFIVVLTVLNTVAAIGLLIWMRKRRGEAGRTTDTTGHVWDGDLREYNNPLPRWWLWLFVLSVLFAVVYVALYPGLGNFRGALGWSQVKQWEQMQAQQEKQAQAILGRFAGRDPLELAADPAAIAIGRNLFANHCAACHGSDARGATGFPNLADADWLWGGDAETVRTSIAQGRMGIMAPWQEVLGDAGVRDTTAYVLTLSGRKAASGDAAAGQAQYAMYCVACHGTDGRGNMAVGAPNLTDGIWLHGGSETKIRETIALGRQNNMPAQEARLGDTRTRLLAAYVLSLGETRRAVAAR